MIRIGANILCKNCNSLRRNGLKKLYSTSLKQNFNINLNDIALNKYLETLKSEYKKISAGVKQNNLRYLELHSIMQILEQRETLKGNLNNLTELFEENNKELKQLVEEEKEELEQKIKDLDVKLLWAILPVEQEDSYNSVVLDVQAGVGGQEAMLFAKELFDMYCNFAEYKGWECELADYYVSDIGGIRHAVALIRGSLAFRYLKHEAGIHRVQRTPVTEKSGRIHTSTASVMAIPQPSEIDVNIKQSDLRIETKRASGAGGQHVNKTESAVRITHLPTKISVECQVDRSQIKNRKIAMARLAALIYERELNEQRSKISSTRKSQVRTKNRNEKIRTYNFNQDRITDHRLGVNIHNLETFLIGGEPLDNLIKQLDEYCRFENLENILNSYK